jgi:hypothetical protein
MTTGSRPGIYEGAAVVYDAVGNTTAAEDARDEAAFAQGRQDLKSGSDCLIVTATLGSPMAGEVQLVQDFRDDTMKQNYLGSHYVTALNAIYYSFGPAVARAIDKEPVRETGDAPCPCPAHRHRAPLAGDVLAAGFQP